MEEEIVNGILNVEQSKHPTPDPNGDCPKCINALETWTCMRCSNDVRTMRRQACPAIPVEQR
jgi:hypothetical protein